MRNIFVEGVRSAFIRIIRLITYIVIGLVIFYIIGLFTSKKAHALAYKGQLWTNNTQSIGDALSGSISEGNRRVLLWSFNNYIFDKQYDYLAFKFGTFEFEKGYQSGNICSEYVKVNSSPSCSGECYTCVWSWSGMNNASSMSYEANMYMAASLRYGASSPYEYTPCYWSDNEKDLLLCPIDDKYNSSPVLQLEINNYNESLYYNVTLNGTKYYFNNESTEIVNGLTGVQQQQQNTITIIQQQIDQEAQQNQYMQSDNVTSSTTNMTTSITTMTDDISQRLSGASELTQIVLAPLALLTGLATDTCAPLVLQVPFVNYTANLPCMKPVFNQYFNGLYSIFTTIISAIMTYWISVKTFSLIKDILDCDNDRIEVIDL